MESKILTDIDWAFKLTANNKKIINLFMIKKSN
jgi:hypothetical protein